MQILSPGNGAGSAAHIRTAWLTIGRSRLVQSAMLFSILFTAAPARSQTLPYHPLAESGRADSMQLDSLVAIALDANPRILEARHRIEAARARIDPAGTIPDPMLGVGIMNLPITNPGFDDFMTMKTVAIEQVLPFPGKLRLAKEAARHEAEAAAARLRTTELDVAADVRKAFFDLAFVDRAADVLRRNQRLLVDIVRLTESKYGLGDGTQSDVLKARIETARVAEEAVALAEQRNAALARLNAMLDRPSETPVRNPAIPRRITMAAVGDTSVAVRFSSPALGARVADPLLPPLAELQERAIRNSPAVREHEAGIAAIAARTDLARKAHLPDFDLSVQYGERANLGDMVSVMISAPVPIHRGSRQRQEVVEMSSEVAALEAEHQAMINEIRAAVAERYGDLERDRAQLALFGRSILPQGRAALASSTASYELGAVDFMTLLQDGTTLSDYETAYYRTLADFAKNLAELERIVAAEVLP